MTREFLPEVEAIGSALAAEAGQYLKSIDTSLDDLCESCALPLIAGRSLCYQCGRHAAAGVPLADRAASLIYAVEPDTQAYLTVRNYKAPRTGPSLTQKMKELLAVGLRGHIECLVQVAGAPIDGWAIVPSRGGRPALRDLVVGLARNPQQEVGISFERDPGRRIMDPEAWVVDISGDPPNHVLVIDDSWVSGASAQSVASALKEAGVAQVSIFTVARILKTNLTEIDEFVKVRLRSMEFDWRRCPWTDTGVCPGRA